MLDDHQRKMKLLEEIIVEPTSVNVARRFMGNQHDAEDVVQECAITTLRIVDRMHLHPLQARAWWNQRLRWACLNALRVRREMLPLNEDWVGSTVDGPEVALLKHEAFEEVMAAVETLSPPQRRALTAVIDDLPGDYEAVGEAIGTSRLGYKSCLHRARANMRAAFAY